MSSRTSTIMPLVSIGLPVYNGGELLRRALDSLLAQDYANFELIISDNASTDGTWDILQEYAARDPRIRLYRNARNEGIVYNTQRVFELAVGEFYMLGSHDDYWASDFISACVAELEAHPEAAMCYVRHLYYDAVRNITDPVRIVYRMDEAEPWRRVCAFCNGWGENSIISYGLFRRTAFQKALPLARVLSPDAVFLLRTIIEGPFIFVDKPLHTYTYRVLNTCRRLEHYGVSSRHKLLILLVYDLRFFVITLYHSQKVASSLAQRVSVLRAQMRLVAATTGFPFPRAMMRHYSQVLPPSFYTIFERCPRLANVLRCITGLKLRPPTPEELDRPFNGARDLQERDSSGPAR